MTAQDARETGRLPTRVAGPYPPSAPAAATADEIARSARRACFSSHWLKPGSCSPDCSCPGVAARAFDGNLWHVDAGLGWFSPPNNVIVTATIQAVAEFPPLVPSRRPSAPPCDCCILGGGAALAFFLLAPAIAHFEHDAELIWPPLRLSSLIVLFYGFYAVFVGAANGAREFHKQSGLRHPVPRRCACLVLAAAVTWHATVPALWGWVLAAAIILSPRSCGSARPARQPPPEPASPSARCWTLCAGWWSITSRSMP